MLLIGGPDNATACAPYGARPVASGNLTTSSQVHLALTQPDACGAGESLGDVEIGSSGEVSQNLQNFKSHSSESNREHLFPYTDETICQYWGTSSSILPIRCWLWVKIGVDMGVRTVCIG